MRRPNFALIDVSRSEVARRRAGSQQRDIDLKLIRVIRRSGSLFAVVGAGATVGAGGPTWKDLVAGLLAIGLGEGFHIEETVPRISITQLLKLAIESSNLNTSREQLGFDPNLVSNPTRTLGYAQFRPEEALEARAILRAIEESNARGAPDVDEAKLKRGAELCWKAAGQHLFAHVTQIIYDKARSPGPAHIAIVELAEPQELPGSPGQHRFGRSALVTYNIDDLMGAALDRRNIPRASYATRAGKISSSWLLADTLFLHYRY